MATRQTSLSFTVSRSLLKLMSIQSKYHPTISSSVAPFSCPPSFPASGSFPMSWLFASGGQSIRVSTLASVLPVNIQGWFPLRLNGLVSVLPMGLSRVFSSIGVVLFWIYVLHINLWVTHVVFRHLSPGRSLGSLFGSAGAECSRGTEGDGYSQPCGGPALGRWAVVWRWFNYGLYSTTLWGWHPPLRFPHFSGCACLWDLIMNLEHLSWDGNSELQMRQRSLIQESLQF